MRILIGVNTYNGAHRIDRLLASIRRVDSGHGDYEILVVDDGTPHGGGASILAAATKHGARYSRNAENRGIAASWNVIGGYAEANGFDALLILNDDTVMTDHFLRAFNFFLENNSPPTVGVVGFTQWFFDAEKFYLSDRLHPEVACDPITKEPNPELQTIANDPGKLMCAPGSAFGMRWEVFTALQGFDAEKHNTFFEESDFGTRLAVLGVPSWVMPWPPIWHGWSETFRHNPELEASARMVESRRNYIRKWRAPESAHQNRLDTNVFALHTDPLYFGPLRKIKHRVKFLLADGAHEGEY